MSFLFIMLCFGNLAAGNLGIGIIMFAFCLLSTSGR